MLPVQNAVPSRYPPVATWGLIVANCVIFLIQLNHDRCGPKAAVSIRRQKEAPWRWSF